MLCGYATRNEPFYTHKCTCTHTFPWNQLRGASSTIRGLWYSASHFHWNHLHPFNKPSAAAEPALLTQQRFSYTSWKHKSTAGCYVSRADPALHQLSQEPLREWQRKRARTRCPPDGCKSSNGNSSVHWHLYSISLGVQPGSPRCLDYRGGGGVAGSSPYVWSHGREPLSIVAYGQWQITFPHWDLIRNRSAHHPWPLNLHRSCRGKKFQAYSFVNWDHQLASIVNLWCSDLCYDQEIYGEAKDGQNQSMLGALEFMQNAVKKV